MGSVLHFFYLHTEKVMLSAVHVHELTPVLENITRDIDVRDNEA